MAARTIVAPSTPPGFSGIAIIRLSGPACREVAARHLGRGAPEPWRMYHGAFRDAEAGETLDQVNWVYFAGPRSATGEDMLEIHCHGNPLVVGALVDRILAHADLRWAEPGEFTRRAFENGKLDLVQAEAVGQLIHAQTQAAWRNARKILAGELSRPLGELREALVELSVRLELDVDFAEEEADPDYASWGQRLQATLARIEGLAATFSRGRLLGLQPRVVIFGAPNAGKSSLINALVGEDRVMVSPRPGTTRDYVEVPLALPGGLVWLVDTAGLGRPQDELDAEAMGRARRTLERADFRLLVVDGTEGAGKPESDPGAAPDFRVLTKSDLPGHGKRAGYLSTSNRTGEGMEEVRAALQARVFPAEGGDGEAEGAVVANERQHAALVRAGGHLRAATAALALRPAVEVAAFEVREAAQCLREMLGEIRPEDVLRRIFEGFCIGK